MSDASSRSLQMVDHRRDWFVPLAFAGLIVGTYLLGVALGTLTRGEPTLLPIVFEPVLYPILFVVMPAVLTAVTTIRGGNVGTSLAIGIVPGLTFPVLTLLARLFGLGQGDAPVWVLSLFFGVIGLFGALAGIGVAVGARYVSRRWGE